MIYHIVTLTELRSHTDGQQYLPGDFAGSGFVHCALEASVLPVANDYFPDAGDTLLLLRIDPSRLRSPTRFEAASPAEAAGTSHLATSRVFPHVHGPIDNAAVTGIGILTKDEHGYVWPTRFMPLVEYVERTPPPDVGGS